MLLDPLGGADEAFFLGIPTAKDDGAFGPPALRDESTDAVDGLEHGGGAAGGVDGAVDPGVAMIAGDNPVAGVLGALDFSDDVPDDAALIVLIGDKVDFYAARPEVVAERQRALPALRARLGL